MLVKIKMYNKTLDTFNLTGKHAVNLTNITLNEKTKVKYILDTLFYYFFPHSQLNKHIKLYSNNYKLYFNDDIITIKEKILFLRIHVQHHTFLDINNQDIFN